MSKKTIGLSVLIAVAVVAAYAGWQAYRFSHDAFCEVCQRPIHGENRTVAQMEGGSQVTYCCPTCALNGARQAGRPITFVSFTDYVTHKTLDPGGAFLVEGSDVNTCVRNHPHELMMDEGHHALPLEFDRCSPSILAFSALPYAEDFIAHHGGKIVTAGQLAVTQP